GVEVACDGPDRELYGLVRRRTGARDGEPGTAADAARGRRAGRIHEAAQGRRRTDPWDPIRVRRPYLPDPRLPPHGTRPGLRCLRAADRHLSPRTVVGQAAYRAAHLSEARVLPSLDRLSDRFR